jgi:two-component system cell cycle response regulator
MESSVDTWVTLPSRHPPIGGRESYLVHIYPTGPGMGTLHALGDKPLVVGRCNDVDIHIKDASVSRRHARIQPGADGYYAIDLQSLNGTFVNDAPASMCKLKDGDYLRIGNCIYRFLTGGNVETEYHEEIYRLTIIDALTGVHNKRYLLEFLDRELARSQRYQRPLSVLMFDIDHFKSVNEEMGHLGGDFALRELTRRVKDGIRKEELFARYGGEEFAVVLPETDRAGAIAIAERIRSLVEARPFEFESHTFSITISLGVATTEGEEGLVPTDLLRQADDRLFVAKRAGRNRVAA